jgi:hypothetical protein
VSGLREIIYGLPDPTMVYDQSKYVLGGCCISLVEPTIKCIECGWKGQNINNAPGLGEEIRMVELQDFSNMNDSQIDSFVKHIWEKLANPKMGEIDDNPKR